MIDNINNIKNNITIEQVANQLNLNLTKSGSSMSGNCPTGHDSKSGTCFSLDLQDNYFKCFHCNKGGDIIELVQLVKQCDKNHAINWLMDSFGLERKNLFNRLNKIKVPLDVYHLTSYYYEQIFDYGKKQLYFPENQEALNYLIHERGYDLETLKRTDWIYFPEESSVRRILTAHESDLADFKNLKLQGRFGDNFRLALPYRNKQGQITAFVKRSSAKDGITITTQDGKIHNNIRYDTTPGKGSKRDLFNLHNCKGQKTLIIVEGCADAQYLHAMGLPNIVAVGQGNLSATHLEGLKEFGVRNVIIAFDNDGSMVNESARGLQSPGLLNTEKAVTILLQSSIRPFVIDPLNLIVSKDPEEFVIANGLEAFNKLAEDAIAGAKWLARRLLQNHDILSDIERENTLQEAISATCSMKANDRDMFLEVIKEKLGFGDEYVQECIQEQMAQLEQKRMTREYEKILIQANSLLAAGKLEEVPGVLNTLTNYSAREHEKSITSYSMDEFQTDLQKTPEGLKTGYHSLDEVIRIPNDAITIIAGRPSHGKTTFLLNLLVNMLETYPDRSFLFFTYEEPKKQIVLKLINIMAGFIFEADKNLINLQRYLKGGHTSKQAIENAKTKLDEYFQSGRLWIIDSYLSAEEIHQYLADFSLEHEIGGVLLDYIQKIPSSGKFGTRQLELQNISGALLETAKSISIPVILGAQLGRDRDKKKEYPVKLDNLREAGDLEQDANLVLGLYNGSMANSIDKNQELTIDTVELDICVLKNRNGVPMVTRSLEFHRPTLTIQDGKSSPTFH